MEYESHYEHVYWDALEQEAKYDHACEIEFKKIQEYALYRLGLSLPKAQALLDDWLHHCPVAEEKMRCLDDLEMETLKDRLDDELKLKIFEKILVRGY